MQREHVSRPEIRRKDSRLGEALAPPQLDELFRSVAEDGCHVI